MKTKNEIILSSDERETRVALLEEDRLVEFHIEQAEKKSLVGRIYKGKVQNVVNGLRGAFVNLGLKKNGFLPLVEIPEYEIFEPELEIEPISKRRGKKIAITEGQEILCQIVKEPFNEKGARLTSFVSLPGRYLVYFPNADRIGISRRIREGRHRHRLREIARKIRKPNVGLIIRTAAETAQEEDLRNEYNNLEKKWLQIKQKSEEVTAPALLYDEPSIAVKLVRDLVTPDTKNLYVDNPQVYKEIISYLETTAPNLCQKVHLYQGSVPIMEHFKIEAQLQQALERKVWLKSGGFITIDQTEALVAIDVNTGRSAKEEDPERLILSTNLEAASEIARQIRLRDLSGLIIIDFIDMQDPKNTERVITELKLCLENDRAKADFSRMSRFGLLEMTRERIRPGLIYTLCETCPTCGGLGRIYARAEIAKKIERAILTKLDVLKGKKVRLLVSPHLHNFLTQQWLEKLGEFVKKNALSLEIKSDSSLNSTDFKILTDYKA
uniref:Rne/Rng family ribonuclease n=1 Tax=candidate division WOR-3 bacterium TaxID=2052148 RepID=A0A7C6EDB9_UNCW3